MKTLRWLGFFAAVSIAASFLSNGVAWAVPRVLNATTFSDLFTGEAGSGSNAFSVATNGARYDIGTGTNDYFSSDGTIVSLGSRLNPGANLSSGATAINLVTGTYLTLNAGEGAFIRAATNGTVATIGDTLDVVGNTINAGGLKVPVVHGTGTAARAIESGSGAMTANALAVTFGTAFGAAPNCICSHQNATPVACGVSVAASTTAVTFAVPTGGATDTVQWFCIGQR